MSPTGHPANFTIQSALVVSTEMADTEFGHGFGWRELLTFLTVPVILFVLVVFSLCLACCKREENRSNVYTVRTPRDDTSDGKWIDLNMFQV